MMVNFDSSGIGVWRSWLARSHGVRKAAGSSPVTPTKYIFASEQDFSIRKSVPYPLQMIRLDRISPQIQSL